MDVEAGRRLGIEAMYLLEALGRVEIAPPLTEAELSCAEAEFEFAFADDHRAFLAAGLPVGDGWPDWRDLGATQLRKQLEWPVEGVLFDVTHNTFWDSSWGNRPADSADALRLARDALRTVPTMVPVYGHRCLPAGQGTFGHPVLSIHQTDVIYYGTDLVDYVFQEFGPSTSASKAASRRHAHSTVGFWSGLL